MATLVIFTVVINNQVWSRARVGVGAGLTECGVIIVGGEELI